MLVKGAKKRIKSLRKYRIKVEWNRGREHMVVFTKNKNQKNFIADYINCNLHFEFLDWLLEEVLDGPCWSIQFCSFVIQSQEPDLRNQNLFPYQSSNEMSLTISC